MYTNHFNGHEWNRPKVVDWSLAWSLAGAADESPLLGGGDAANDLMNLSMRTFPMLRIHVLYVAPAKCHSLELSSLWVGRMHQEWSNFIPVHDGDKFT